MPLTIRKTEEFIKEIKEMYEKVKVVLRKSQEEIKIAEIQ